MGGVLPGGPRRFDAILQRGIPYVISLGALDMVNFGARQTVPEQFADRRFVVHNPQVTLMRTTAEENAEMGRWIGRKLNACDGPVRLLLPEKGVSALDIEGGAFRDPEADAALFDALRDTIEDKARLVFLPCHINDPAFAEAAANIFQDLMEP